MPHSPDRIEAFDLLKEFTKSENLIHHALAVEGTMRHFAALYGGDVEKWGIVGLVHDLDWEMYPDAHCVKVREILEPRDWPEEYIRAIQSHGWELCVDVKPESDMEKVLYTVDELTGLVTATALVRPSKSVLDMEPKSVKKKWKLNGFAAGVNREVIEKGAGLMGRDLDWVIAETIGGMKAVAKDIGL
jgi:predicted hydrolase (HD superfamily)